MSLLMAATKFVPRLWKAWLNLTTEEKFAYGRLGFAGALAGVALLGTFFWSLGIPQNVAWDFIAGCTGAVVGVCAKMA